MGMGEIIKKARLEKGLTQEELGKLLGVEKSAIAKYENGRVKNPKMATLKRMTEVLGVNLLEIIEQKEGRLVETETDTDAKSVSPGVLGSRIKEARLMKGLTQGELAEELGVTKYAIHNYEKGKVSNIPYKRLEKIAKMLGTTPDHLIGWGNDNEEEIAESVDSRTALRENLRYYMTKAQKTQKEISQDIGVSAPTFSDWCNGKKYPRIEKLEALAEYFGISVPTLIGGENIEIPEEKYANPGKVKNNIQVLIGARIRERRKELHMTVDELAARIGKDRATVYRYEGGEIENMPIGLLAPLAEALDVPIEYLISIGKQSILQSDCIKRSEDSRKSNNFDVGEGAQEVKPNILEIILRRHTDTEYLEVIERISKLDDDKMKALKQFLTFFCE